MENAGGPLGLLGRGINQTKVAFSSFNTALKASIIGLIATAVAGLVAAFSQSEVAMKKLQPIFIAFERILGGIFRAMEPLLDAFVEMINYILPPLTKGIGIFYSTLFGLFTLIKEVGVGIGKTLKGIFTFDWDSITEGVSQAANGITTALKAGTQAYQQYMSPYQQQVIDTTLQQYDIQAQKGLPALAAQAIGSGAYGGGREGVQQYHNAKGVARLVEGQYRGSHIIRLHQGKYEALGQAKNNSNEFAWLARCICLLFC